MADIGTVMSWLEGLAQEDWRENHSDTEVRGIAVAAINALRGQAPVKPLREYSGDGTTWWYVCGACRTAINPNDKYCHECGRSVKW